MAQALRWGRDGKAVQPACPDVLSGLLHALLAGALERKTRCLKQNTAVKLTRLLHELFILATTKNLTCKYLNKLDSQTLDIQKPLLIVSFAKERNKPKRLEQTQTKLPNSPTDGIDDA